MTPGARCWCDSNGGLRPAVGDGNGVGEDVADGYGSGESTSVTARSAGTLIVTIVAALFVPPNHFVAATRTLLVMGRRSWAEQGKSPGPVRTAGVQIAGNSPRRIASALGGRRGEEATEPEGDR